MTEPYSIRQAVTEDVNATLLKPLRPMEVEQARKSMPPLSPRTIWKECPSCKLKWDQRHPNLSWSSWSRPFIICRWQSYLVKLQNWRPATYSVLESVKTFQDKPSIEWNLPPFSIACIASPQISSWISQLFNIHAVSPIDNALYLSYQICLLRRSRKRAFSWLLCDTRLVMAPQSV